MKLSRHPARSRRSLLKGFHPRAKAIAFATFSVASLFAGQAAQAVNYSYIGTGDGNWNAPANYTTVAAGTAGTATTAYPLAADSVLFNFAGNYHNENIFLNGNEAVTAMTFANTGFTTTLLGGAFGGAAAVNTLTISGGLTLASGTGAVTIGDSSTGTPAAVTLSLVGGQTFTNNSTSLLTINNGVSFGTAVTRATTLTIAGPGNTTFNGVIANGGGTGGSLGLSLTGSGTVTLNGANTYTNGNTMSAGSTLNLQGTLQTGVTNTQGTLIIGSATNSAAGVTGGTGATTISSAGLTGVTTAATADIYGVLGGTGATTVSGGFNLGAFTASTFTLETTGKITSSGATSFLGSTATIAGAISGGATTVTQSTLNLDYSANNASHLTDAGILTLNSTTVNLIGGSHAETVGSTTLGGSSSFGVTTIARSSGTSSLALGAITRTAGSTLSLSANNVASTSTVNVNGIMATGNAAYAVVGTSGTTPGVSATADFAVGATTAGTPTLITAYTGYSVFGTTTAGVTAASGAGTATNNYLLTDNGTTFSTTATAGFTGYTLKLDDTMAGQSLVIGGGTGTGTAVPALTLNGGGLLFVGGYDYSITGGSLRSNGGNSELVVHQYGAGNLTIGSSIVTATLTKDGAGTLTLAGTNTITGNTLISQGTLAVAGTAVTPFGTATTTAVYLQTGATLNLSAAPAGLTLNALNSVNAYSQGSVVLGNNTLTLGTAAVVGSFGGVISGTGGLTKQGANTQTLNGLNTYSGVTTLNGGILNVGGLLNGGQASGLGQSSNAAANLVFGGGTLQYTAGTNASTDRSFTIGTAATIDASGANASVVVGSLGLVNFTNTGPLSFTGATNHVLNLVGSDTGVLAATQTTITNSNIFAAQITDQSAAQTTSVTKSGGAVWTLTNTNSYSGGTTVSAGRLNVTQAGGLGTGTVTVNSGGGVALFSGGTVTNNFILTGAGANPGGSGGVSGNTGALQLQNGTNVSGTVTISGGTTISANYAYSDSQAVSNLSGTVSGRITGTGGLTIGSPSGLSGGIVTLSNTGNNYTGNTTILESSTSGGATSGIVVGAASTATGGVIPHGANAGNLIFNNGASSGTMVLALNGNNLTINGLQTAGGLGGGRSISNNSATAATLTVGDGDANGSYFGSFATSVTANGFLNNSTATGTLGLAKIGTGTQSIGFVTAGGSATAAGSANYTGATTVNAGSLVLDYNQAVLTNSSTVFNGVAPTSTLSLGGGTLEVLGKGAGAASATTAAAYATGATTLALTSAAGLVAGETISGNGITAGTTITKIDLNTNTITISAATTATGTSGQALTLTPLSAAVAGNTNQTLNNTALAAGSSGIVVNANGGNGTVFNAGTITRSVQGTTVDFTLPTGTQSATNGVTTKTTTNTNGVMTTSNGTAYATVAGTNWAANTQVATAGSTVSITPVTTTADTYTPTTNTDVVTSTSQSGVTVNTLRFGTGGTTLDLTGGFSTVGTGGVLVTSAATAANPVSITSTDGTGGLAPGSGQELVIVNNGNLNMSAQVMDGNSGATNLSISGFGTTTFTGVNSYQGTTVLNGGVYTPGVNYTAATRPIQTVYVNGGVYDPQITAQSTSGLGNNSLVVNTNVVLGGTGVINTLAQGGNITINGGATVSPGGAPGAVGVLSFVSTTTAFVGSPTLGLARLAMDVTATGADLLRVFGDLDLSSPLDQLTVTGTTGLASYQLVTFTGARTGTFDTVTIPTGYQLAYVDAANGLPGEVDLVAVPEPGTWAALGLGGVSAALGLARRRRQQQAA